MSLVAFLLDAHRRVCIYPIGSPALPHRAASKIEERCVDLLRNSVPRKPPSISDSQWLIWATNSKTRSTSTYRAIRLFHYIATDHSFATAYIQTALCAHI